jgi:hypothetical protein
LERLYAYTEDEVAHPFRCWYVQDRERKVDNRAIEEAVYFTGTNGTIVVESDGDESFEVGYDGSP